MSIGLRGVVPEFIARDIKSKSNDNKKYDKSFDSHLDKAKESNDKPIRKDKSTNDRVDKCEVTEVDSDKLTTDTEKSKIDSVMEDRITVCENVKVPNVENELIGKLAEIKGTEFNCCIEGLIAFAEENNIAIEGLESIEELVDDYIAYMLSQGTNVPVGEIEIKLEELCIKPTELNDKDKLNQLVSSLYGIEEHEMLIKDIPIKELNMIHEEIESLVKELVLPAIDSDTQNSSLEMNKLNTYIEGDSLDESNKSVKTGKSDESEEYSGVKLPSLSVAVENNGVAELRVEKHVDANGRVLTKQVRTVNINNQLFEKLHIQELKTGKELFMELNPKELGKLSFRLVENNSVYVGSIKVENDKAKDLVNSQLAELKETLEKQGLVIEKLEVEVQEQSHKELVYEQRSKSSKRINDLINKHLDELIDETGDSDTAYIGSNSIGVDVTI